MKAMWDAHECHVSPAQEYILQFGQLVTEIKAGTKEIMFTASEISTYTTLRSSISVNKVRCNTRRGAIHSWRFPRSTTVFLVLVSVTWREPCFHVDSTNLTF